jgi:uncharacterized protein (DUF433 family)
MRVPKIPSGTGAASRMIREFIISDPEIQDGEPIFTGTGVTVETFLRYRRGDTPVYEFLVDHPTVTPEHAKRLARWLATQDADSIRARLEQIRVRQPNNHE